MTRRVVAIHHDPPRGHLLGNPDLPRPQSASPSPQTRNRSPASMPACPPISGPDFAYYLRRGPMRARFRVRDLFGRFRRRHRHRRVDPPRRGRRARLVNAIHLASRIVETLPQATMTPETTPPTATASSIAGSTARAAPTRWSSAFIPARLRAGGGLEAKGALVRQSAPPSAATRAAATDRRPDHPAIPQHALLAEKTTWPRVNLARSGACPISASTRSRR